MSYYDTGLDILGAGVPTKAATANAAAAGTPVKVDTKKHMNAAQKVLDVAGKLAKSKNKKAAKLGATLNKYGTTHKNWAAKAQTKKGVKAVQQPTKVHGMTKTSGLAARATAALPAYSPAVAAAISPKKMSSRSAAALAALPVDPSASPDPDPSNPGYLINGATDPNYVGPTAADTSRLNAAADLSAVAFTMSNLLQQLQGGAAAVVTAPTSLTGHLTFLGLSSSEIEEVLGEVIGDTASLVAQGNSILDQINLAMSGQITVTSQTMAQQQQLEAATDTGAAHLHHGA